MASPDNFPTESPYQCEKIRHKICKILAQSLDPIQMVDELSPPLVDPLTSKTYYIPEQDGGALIICPREGTEALVWPPCSSECKGAAWSELPNDLPKSLKILDLGHDGLLYGQRPTSENDEAACRKIVYLISKRFSIVATTR
jgi:hypothetical protein